MIKFRLRAASSLYHLFAGNYGLVPSRKILIPSTSTSVQSKGFRSRLLHTSANEDDDFAELGLPTERCGVVLKLKTEKLEPFVNISGTKKKSHGSSSKADSFLNVKDVSPKVENSSAVPSLDSEYNNDERSNFRTASSVTIKNVPSVITLLQLKEAASVFGNVKKAFKRSVPNGLDHCDIEFKSAKSSRRALSTGSITIDNFSLPICPIPSLKTVTIRIGNISSKTADSAIHSTCTSCGHLAGLLRTKEDVVDAVFCVEAEADIKGILNKLNSTVMDGCLWSAQHSESPTMATTSTSNGDAQDDLGLKISEGLADFKRELFLKKICAEDLDVLHHSLRHLENHPQPQFKHHGSNMD